VERHISERTQRERMYTAWGVRFPRLLHPSSCPKIERSSRVSTWEEVCGLSWADSIGPRPTGRKNRRPPSRFKDMQILWSWEAAQPTRRVSERDNRSEIAFVVGHSCMTEISGQAFENSWLPFHSIVKQLPITTLDILATNG
jgi:hypothetical protein